MIFLLFSVSILSSCGQTIVKPYFSCSPILEEPYGITSHIGRKTADYEVMDEQLQLMKCLGINWVRADLDWRQNKSVLNHYSAYNEFLMDSVVIKTQREGIKLLPILSTFDRNYVYAWDDFENYKSYVKYIIDRYGKSFSHIEVMNEINLIKDSTGNYNVAKYANHYNQVFPTLSKHIRSADSNKTVVIGGLGRLDDDFLERIVKKKAPDYFDIMNFHCYEASERFERSFRKLKKSMEDNNWNKKVWLTETGYSVDLDSINNKRSRTVEDQAKYIARAYLICFAYGVDKVFLYNLKDWKNTPYQRGANYGILYYDMRPKPGLKALRTLINFCPSGATRPSLIIDGYIYLSKWKRPDGKYIYAIWSAQKNEDVILGIQGKYEMFDYMGNRLMKAKKKGELSLSLNTGVTFIVGPRQVKIK